MRRHDSRPTRTSRPTGNTDYADITRALGLQKEQARRLLPALVGRMGREIYDREWVPELPYLLWEKVAGEKGASPEFRGEEIALFRLLVRVADGWVCADREHGLKFVRRSRWLRAHAAWKRTARPQKTGQVFDLPLDSNRAGQRPARLQTVSSRR